MESRVISIFSLSPLSPLGDDLAGAARLLVEAGIPVTTRRAHAHDRDEWRTFCMLHGMQNVMPIEPERLSAFVAMLLNHGSPLVKTPRPSASIFRCASAGRAFDMVDLGWLRAPGSEVGDLALRVTSDWRRSRRACNT